MFYVYELRDHEGKPFYIGKGSGKRHLQHRQRARRGVKTYTCAKIRKLWSAGYDFTPHIVFHTETEEEAFSEERRLIALYGRENLTNLTDGGDGPSNPTQETRAKIAAARKGVRATEETRRKLRDSHLGNRHTPETRSKIAAKQRTIKKPWAITSSTNLGDGFKGKTWSDEHRAKFKAARTGHQVSQETRDKISNSKKGSIPWNKKSHPKT